MAITSLDQVINGMQAPVEFAKQAGGTGVAGRLLTPFYVSAGFPVPATAPTPGVAGAALTTYTGQLPFVNGAADQYLARLTCADTTGTGVVLLCDRLWHNSGIDVTSTSAQTINSVALPARDHNASTDGAGIYVGLEVSTVTGAGASVHSIEYTNSAGAGTKTGTPRVPYAAVSDKGNFYDYTLAAGDTGVRSIQSFTSTVSMTSGVVHLVMYRVLARLSVATSSLGYSVDAITGGMCKMHDNTVPFLLFLPTSNHSPSFQGTIVQSNG